MTTTVPTCAHEGCTEAVRMCVTWHGIVLAFACSAEHLRAFDYATRHLPDRTVESIKPEGVAH